MPRREVGDLQVRARSNEFVDFGEARFDDDDERAVRPGAGDIRHGIADHHYNCGIQPPFSRAGASDGHEAVAVRRIFGKGPESELVRQGCPREFTFGTRAPVPREQAAGTYRRDRR